MLERFPPQQGEPETFIELLRYLIDVSEHQRDSHFGLQSYFEHESIVHRKPYFSKMHADHMALDYTGGVGQLEKHLSNIYQRTFKRHPDMRSSTIEAIRTLPIRTLPKLNNLLMVINSGRMQPPCLQQ